MKNIFIGGMYRTGKSTLSSMLYHQLHYSIFELDTVVHAFTKAMPDSGISEKDTDGIDKMFFPFADVMLKCCNYSNIYSNIVTAINGWYLMPESVSKLQIADNLMVFYLGITNMTTEQLVNTIKQTSSPHDWILDKSDDKIYKLCDQLIEKSKFIKAECEKYGFHFIETGINREQALQNVVNYIKNNNN